MTAPCEQMIAITGTEYDTAHGVGPLALAVYMHLRRWMDYGTGIVGKSRPISLAMIGAYTETHTPRGQGTEIVQASERSIRTALARLVRCGLLRRLSGDRLAFRLPLAQTKAQSRPEQTRHDGDTDFSTEPDSANATPHKAARAEPGTRQRHRVPANPAHIRVQENQNLQPAPAGAVDNYSASGTGRVFSKERGQGADRAHGHAGASGEHRLLMLGKRRGIDPRPGESWAEYRARLFAPRRQQAAPEGLHTLGGWLGLVALEGGAEPAHRAALGGLAPSMGAGMGGAT